ncbi:ribosyldihydronicotinamide dehydrogenase [quinone] isoform X2 [Ailuropoda melanoleuca]|uniref:ribosyldihydronicotinamide dehydrogenase [quinone] isoform X2 n=1 Tax=Ailuropoda melanoleuca TaxID=9646 RepID=UPI001494D7C3|nr:ribosyldihydronicotinamide dehydrogenase [quinone] isoform X2 [Ailuropoda melanoleuca]
MAGKKVLIVYAHQEPRSFNGSLKKVAVEELSKQGCAITVSDLYAMDFEPRATRKDVIDRDLHLPVVIKTEEVMCGAQHLIGALSNPKFFNYGVEAYEAFKKRSLASDITDEQKKVQEADLVIFQFPLYWFSVPAILKGWMDRVLCQGFAFDIPGFYDSGFLKNKLALLSLTTGGTAEMYGKTGVSGDFRYFLWPLQISFAPEIASEEERKAMVASWAQRLKTIWEEEPIDCTPAWYFGH